MITPGVMDDHTGCDDGRLPHQTAKRDVCVRVFTNRGDIAHLQYSEDSRALYRFRSEVMVYFLNCEHRKKENHKKARMCALVWVRLEVALEVAVLV